MTKKDILRRIYDLHAEVEVEHDKDRADAKRAEIAKLERQITSGGTETRNDPDTRGVRFGNGAEVRAGAPEYRDNASIEGRPNERLKPGQSMTEWVRRAAENGVTTQRSDGMPVKVEHRDNAFLNEAFGQMLGFTKPGAELRALGEDTSSGSGAGQAIAPQSWTAHFIDCAISDDHSGQGRRNSAADVGRTGQRPATDRYPGANVDR